MKVGCRGIPRQQLPGWPPVPGRPQRPEQPLPGTCPGAGPTPPASTHHPRAPLAAAPPTPGEAVVAAEKTPRGTRSGRLRPRAPLLCWCRDARVTYEVSDRAGSQMTRLRLPALGVFPELGIRGTGPRQPKKGTVLLSPHRHQGHQARGAAQRAARSTRPGLHTRVQNSALLTGRPPALPSPYRALPNQPHGQKHGRHGFPPTRIWRPGTSWPTLACRAGRKLGALVPKSPGEGDSAQPRAGDHSRESLYAHYGMLCGHAEVTRGTDVENMSA